jgi:hypothetical protein
MVAARAFPQSARVCSYPEGCHDIDTTVPVLTVPRVLNSMPTTSRPSVTMAADAGIWPHGAFAAAFC